MVVDGSTCHWLLWGSPVASYYLPVSTLNKWKLSSVTCIQIFTDKVSTVNSLQKLHEYFYLGAACEMTMTVIVGLKNFFIYLCSCWVFVAAQAFLWLWRLGATLEFQCMGFSFQWLLLSWTWALGCVGFGSGGSQALEHRLSGCGTQA